MHCPVCGGNAEPIAEASADVIAVRCARCGPFEVSRVSSEPLERSAPEARLRALRDAQTFALPGRRPYLHGLT